MINMSGINCWFFLVKARSMNMRNTVMFVGKQSKWTSASILNSFRSNLDVANIPRSQIKHLALFRKICDDFLEFVFVCRSQAVSTEVAR